MAEWLPEDGRLRRAGKHLCVEGVRLDKVAHEVGTPVYVYSRAAIEDNWRRFDAAFGARPHLVCYAVKACSNIAVLALLAELGSGFDIVSGGELARALRAGCDPRKVFFSGVGKQAHEIERALHAGIGSFNIESESELGLLEQKVEAAGGKASVAVRVNPDVDANTHPHITTGRHCDKFGVTFEAAAELYRRLRESEVLEGCGIDCHVGSQVTDPSVYARALRRVLAFADELRAGGHPISHLDVGGGFAIAYDDEPVPAVEDYVKTITDLVADRPYRTVVEPGRAIVGNAGVLVTEVLYVKGAPGKNFIVVDAAMNDLMRPVLYRARHRIVPLEARGGQERVCDVVGPVCESGDTLAADCTLAGEEGARLAVLSAGAYGFSMAGNYNSRPRPAEVIVDGDEWHIVRLRESTADLLDGECLLPGMTGGAPA